MSVGSLQVKQLLPAPVEGEHDLGNFCKTNSNIKARIQQFWGKEEGYEERSGSEFRLGWVKHAHSKCFHSHED